MTTNNLFRLMEKAPPGREPQVRALKGKVNNPYAVSWASYNDEEGGPGSGRKPMTSVQGAPINPSKAFRKGKPIKVPKPKKPKKTKASQDPILVTMVEAELKAKKRNALPKKSFAVPGERKFPIHDKSHARNALARASGTKYEKQVRAAVHRKYPGIGKEECEANSSGGLPQTLRDGMRCGATDWGSKLAGMKQADRSILKFLLKESVQKVSYRFSESALMEVVAPVQKAVQNSVQEGPRVTCWLITEGLGNRADMHYYGPECIQAGAPLFEGQPCFIDHQKRSEQQDQPERTVRDKCGYFRNVEVARDENGKLGLRAELHYDLSETGRYAYDKACTAIHYKQEFPGSDKEYVGLSIAADGKLEEKTMMVGEEVLDVKYVTEFTAVGSVDEVTSPARGGRFTAVLDS